MYLLKRESLTGFNLKLKDQWGQYYQMYFNADFDVAMYADRLVIERGMQNAELPVSAEALLYHSCIRAKALP